MFGGNTNFKLETNEAHARSVFLFIYVVRGKVRNVKIEPERETDLGYKVVFRASKFQK